MKVIEITEQTKIPLKLVVSISAGIIAFTVWLTTIFRNQITQAEQIASIQKVESNHSSENQVIRENIVEIKTELKNIRIILENKRR